MGNEHIGELVLSQQQISQGVSTVAKQLNHLYEGKTVVLITVVPGGILFTADLVRQLNFDVEMDYISCPHTTGDRQNNSTIVYHQNIEINNKPVIVIDDAIESGGTMQRLIAHLSTQFSPSSLAIASLLVKPGRVDIPVKQHFAHLMDSDDMLVGYGLPWNNLNRNLPYISKLNTVDDKQ
ncbi:hypoxanthine phosphoribosyltransferase [Agarivorans sp. B2Z047]|uniref:phosphoribosyltransferase n=1 Tax=Agarivorans sp. B2Z047 TaxID=2652721 RepID=UPI00128BCBF8|nr:phosphoribosyltransferase family protein [Agarivorans sp. B2Z047]MPW31758.1 hypoxanthine phosphoribosyltransferase [Agarivorans sp. B2Z047]UQN44820.1 hypoxanthine phosphoribosyltransferase [Agarivorans sp. B2Z047]